MRSFRIFLLIALAPIIAVMNILYSLKGNGGLLKEWGSLYITYMIMQPLHALLYLIFMFMLSEIALNAPLLGIIFLWMLLKAEKIIKVILNINFGNISSLFSKSSG